MFVKTSGNISVIETRCSATGLSESKAAKTGCPAALLGGPTADKPAWLRLRRLRTGSRPEARWRGRGYARGRRACLRRGRRCRRRNRLPGGLRHSRTYDVSRLGGTDVAEDHTKRTHGDYRADTDGRRPQLPLRCLHLDQLQSSQGFAPATGANP
jgi:hypothetical protein